jgi:hypothetical protein
LASRESKQKPGKDESNRNRLAHSARQNRVYQAYK